MIEVRNFVGGMDLDSSLYDVAKGYYLDALNINKNDISANNDYAATNVVGNRQVSYTYPAGTGKYIGAFPFQLRNTVIGFRWNVNGYHGVYEYNHTTRVISKIFESRTDSDGIDILNFTEHGKITSVNVYPRDEGDLLFFLDSLGRPTEMDISMFKAGTYTPVTRAIIDTGKKPPLSPPSLVYDNDTTTRSNNFRKKLIRGKYRWIYDSFEKSAWSPISSVPLPVSILSDVYTNVVTNNNVVRWVLNSGDKNVKSVEVAFSFVEASNDWSDFQSIEVIDKATAVIDDNVDFPFAFYNDSTYPDIDINESILLYDYIPDYAGAQDMPNGNILLYGAITEGYDKDTTEDAIITVSTIAAGNGGVVGNLSAIAVTNNVFAGLARGAVVFSGIPATGTVINLKLRRQAGHVTITGGTYTTLAGDTPNSIASAIDFSVGGATVSARSGTSFSFQISSSTYEVFPATTDYLQVEIVPPTTATATNSIATWKWSTSRNIARAYFDEKGKTNGILYTDKVTFPAYSENGSQQPLLPYINYKINDVPPDWAYSMQFYFTKEATDYKVWESLSVQIETEYIYFEVTSLITNASKKPTTAQVLSYNFQDGDRLRIWRDTDSPGVVFADTFDSAIEGLVTTPTINGTVTTTGSLWIKIKNVAPFTGVILTTKNYVIELYRPAQQAANKENQVYYELGRQYAILDPTLSTRRHSGEVTDQVVGVTPAEFNFYEGDAYFRSRTIASTDTGYATFNVMDRNFVDFYISAVSSIDGRPNIIDINARRQYYSTLVRFGQAYQANTNINGLNRFYPNNFDEYDYNFGDIIRLKVRDRYIKIFQKFKIGTAPLYSQLTKDPNGNEVKIVTDKLLNPIQYRIGNFGLSAPESLASWHFADYGCDTNKGIIWRDSNDGVIPISELYKVDSWATVELPLRTGDTKIYGAINPKTNQYIAALEEYVVPVPFVNILATGLLSIISTAFTVVSTSSFTVDWGDGTTDIFAAGTRHPTHTYSSAYTGNIRISSNNLGDITLLTISGGVSNILPASVVSMTILTSEATKLTGLTTFSFGTEVFIQGVVTELPDTLVTLGTVSTNLSGNTLDLPRTITNMIVTGGNTIIGLASDLPTGLTTLILYGNNTLTGDLLDLPRTIIVLAIHGNNTLFGDVGDLPPSVVIIEITGNNTVSGDIAGFPATLHTITVYGSNTIFGNISSLLSSLLGISILGDNVITGDVATIASAVISFFQITGSNTISGDVAFMPASLKVINVSSSFSTVNAYTNGVKTWSSTMDSIRLVPGSGGLPSSDVDDLLIELAAQATTWVNSKVVSILGGSGSRTVASNAAVVTLNSRGVTVATN